MASPHIDEAYKIFSPSTGKARKNFLRLKKQHKKQVDDALGQLRKNPLNFGKNIEKLHGSDSLLGQYTIRVTLKTRIFYDVNPEIKSVYIVNAGPHDLYKLITKK